MHLPPQVLTGPLFSFFLGLSFLYYLLFFLFLLLSPPPFYFINSKLICSPSLAFLLGLAILVYSQKGGHEVDRGPEAGPPSPVTGPWVLLLPGMVGDLSSPLSAQKSCSLLLVWNTHLPLPSPAPSFPCGPHVCPMMVSSAHKGVILFYRKNRRKNRKSRKNRSYCFQKVHSSRDRPIYKTVLVTNICYCNRTLLAEI